MIFFVIKFNLLMSVHPFVGFSFGRFFFLVVLVLNVSTVHCVIVCVLQCWNQFII